MRTPERATSSGRLAPFAQAGLAALVAGSLLTFSILAFDTAFETSGSQAVTARAPDTGEQRPVVLPGTPPPTRTHEAEAEVRVISPSERSTVVLGNRITKGDAAPSRKDSAARWLTGKFKTRSASHEADPASAEQEDAHPKGKGVGHIKAPGKGHHKDEHNEGRGHKSKGPKSKGPKSKDHKNKGHKGHKGHGKN